MKIKGQEFEVTSTYLIFRLREPFWSAWQRFGWEYSTTGYSVNEEAVNRALELKKKILIKTRYGDYEITPTKALREGGRMDASNGTPLICIPKYALKKLPEITEEKIDLTKAMGKMVNTPEWEKLRKKLHG